MQARNDDDNFIISSLYKWKYLLNNKIIIKQIIQRLCTGSSFYRPKSILSDRPSEDWRRPLGRPSVTRLSNNLTRLSNNLTPPETTDLAQNWAKSVVSGGVRLLLNLVTLGRPSGLLQPSEGRSDRMLLGLCICSCERFDHTRYLGSTRLRVEVSFIIPSGRPGWRGRSSTYDFKTW